MFILSRESPKGQMRDRGGGEDSDKNEGKKQSCEAEKYSLKCCRNPGQSRLWLSDSDSVKLK